MNGGQTRSCLGLFKAEVAQRRLLTQIGMQVVGSAMALEISLSGSFRSPNRRALVTHVETHAGRSPFSVRCAQYVHLPTTPVSGIE